MSLLGRLARGVVGTLTGGPAVGVAAALAPTGGRSRRSHSFMPPAAPVRPPIRVGPVGINPSAALPGGRPLFTPAAPVAAPPSVNGAGAPAGYHLNKSSYFLKDGTYVEKGTRYVRNRRRNPMNPRALKRAVARIDAAKSWQATLSGISTPKYTGSGKRRDKC